jgi:hypothetical protein
MFSQINGLFAGVNFNRHTGPAAQGIVVDDFLAEDFTSIEHGFVGDATLEAEQQFLPPRSVGSVYRRMCGSGASPTATTSWAGNTSEWSASSPTRSVYSEAHRGKGPDGARARCGSDRLRPPRSKQGVPSLRRRSLAAASEEGFRLKVCQLVEGGVFVRAGGVKAPELVADSGVADRPQWPRQDRPVPPRTGPPGYLRRRRRCLGRGSAQRHVLPPAGTVAREEGETAARNLDAELKGRPLKAYTFHDKGFVVSAGARRGVADIAGITSGGQLAHLLKDASEWEYRQSVSHLRGWNNSPRQTRRRDRFDQVSPSAPVLRPYRSRSASAKYERVRNRRTHCPQRPVHQSVVASVVQVAQRHLSIGLRLSLCGCSGR